MHTVDMVLIPLRAVMSQGLYEGCSCGSCPPWTAGTLYSFCEVVLLAPAQRKCFLSVNKGLEKVKGGVGKFEKPARDTLFVIFHGMLLTSR